MKKVFRFIAAAALVCLCATSCDKDNKEDNEVKGPTDFSGGCEAVDLGITTKDGKPLKWRHTTLAHRM